MQIRGTDVPSLRTTAFRGQVRRRTTNFIAAPLERLLTELGRGPFAFVVRRGVDNSGWIAWGERDKEVSIGILDVMGLLRSAVAAAKR